MERLTLKAEENNPYIHGKAYVTCNVKGCLSITCEADPPCERMQEVVDRLYDFENIFGDDYDLDRLRKLVEEDRAGRCKTLEKMVLEYQETIVPGYRKLAEKAMEERDAAVSDLETIMLQGGPDTCAYCRNDRCYGRGGRDCCNPIWRGRDNPSVTEKP